MFTKFEEFTIRWIYSRFVELDFDNLKQPSKKT